ncbi:MAG: MBL fold metallo-hydrolase [Chitinophagaceae bacterium]
MSFLQPAKKEGKKFLNPVPTSMSTDLLKAIVAYATSKNQRVPLHPPGPFVTDTSIYNTAPASGLRITWIGHSSLLIEIDGVRILTDPVWSERVSFSSLIGPRRFFAPPLALQNLPPLDAVLLSHDHYDHLDKATIQWLSRTKVPFYCSLGVGPYLQQFGVPAERITQLNWMDQAAIGSNCTLIALPARHFSGRGLFNRFQTLWSSFVICTPGHNVYFGADSGWFDGFEEIGKAYGPFDLTMIEIGASDPLWADIHLGPDLAFKAHQALKGKQMMPIHWGTFNLALHDWRQPIERLLQLATPQQVPLLVPTPGEPVEVTGVDYNTKWWIDR